MVTTATETATAILEAATQQMQAQGEGGLRVDAVAATANCNKRLIYHYFGNREGLVLAVYQHQANLLLGRDSGLSASTKAFLKRLLQQCEPQIIADPQPVPAAEPAPRKEETTRSVLAVALAIWVPVLLRGVAREGSGFMHGERYQVEDLQRVVSELVSGLVIHQGPGRFKYPSTESERSLTSAKPRYRMPSVSRIVD